MRAAPRSVPVWSVALPILVVIAATVGAVAYVTYNSSPRTPTVSAGPATIGARAPDFSTWDLNGNPVHLGALVGKPVLLTFWATWCTACQEELPALQKIEDAYAGTGLTVVAVDYRETDTSRMTSFLGGLHVHFDGVIDPQGAIASAYGVDVGLPVNVWLDRGLVVRRIMTGAQSETLLAGAAQQVAGPGPVSGG